MIAHGRAPFCGLVCRVESVPRKKPSHVESTALPTSRPTRRGPPLGARDVHVGDATMARRPTATCARRSEGTHRLDTLSARSRDRPPARTKSELSPNATHEQPRAASPSGARAAAASAAAVPDVERTCGLSHWARLTEGHRSGVSTTHCVCKERPGLSRPPAAGFISVSGAKQASKAAH